MKGNTFIGTTFAEQLNSSSEFQHQIFQMVAQTVHGLFYHYGCNAQSLRLDCDDVIQDSLEKIHLHSGIYNPEKASVNTWVNKIVSNTFIDALGSESNRAARFTSIDAAFHSDDDEHMDCESGEKLIHRQSYERQSSGSADGELIAKETFGQISRRVTNPSDRKVLHCLLNGEDNDVIAKALGCSKNTAATRKSRLLQNIQLGLAA